MSDLNYVDFLEQNAEDERLSVIHSLERDVLALTGCKVHTFELFNPYRLAEFTSLFGLMGEPAYDLRVGKDLSDPSVQAQVWRDLETLKPRLVLGSPPCAPFSLIQSLNKDSKRKREALEKGLAHLRFCCQVYEWCCWHGVFFLHEHPATAWSWKLPEVQALLTLPDVSTVKMHQCRYGQTVKGKPVFKPTIWMGNCRQILQKLDKQCDRSHEHQQLIGGLAKHAERYTPQMVKCILSGLREALVELGEVGSLEAGPTVEEPEFTPWLKDCYVHPDDKNFYDEYTGMVLPREGVIAARDEEMKFMTEQLGTWTVMRRSDLPKGAKVITCRWIDHNKGDADNVILRSRLVLQETKKVSSIAADDIGATFSATPPLESLRLLLSLAMSLDPMDPDDDLVFVFIDISRAHPHCDVLRDIYMELPKEAGYTRDFVAHLQKCLYGARDAGQAFEFLIKDIMETELDSTQGLFSPCHYYSRTRQERTWIHGDDFAMLMPRSRVTQFVDKLSARLIVKVRAVLGPRPSDDRSVRLLNRIITWRPRSTTLPEAIEWEADPRHAALIIEQLGLTTKAKSVTSPGDRACANVLEGPVLSGQSNQMFGSVCMRTSFLAADRPDIGFTSKEAARAMANRTETALQSLKRQGRYLLGAPRLVWVFERQRLPKKLTIYTDANYAGCFTTRKSTTCVVVMLGQHLIKFGSWTQGILALSVGESEFYACTKGASVSLGIQSILKDWGLDLMIELRTDSSSSLGTAARRGAGTLRHIETPYLWLQQARQRRQLELVKWPGTKNPADLGTKVLDGPTIRRCLNAMNLEVRHGSHELAYKVVG